MYLDLHHKGTSGASSLNLPAQALQGSTRQFDNKKSLYCQNERNSRDNSIKVVITKCVIFNIAWQFLLSNAVKMEHVF